ncbi:MAG: SAM-dependent methyltransferase, partial [Bacteroidia bacterium]|nr:SAM-dependent methyltransferase [Bacteroidia bacterium]
EKLTLPTETWREYIQRRQRCLELRHTLARGGIQSINDLITYNLNIRQFAQDILETTEGPELLRAFWNALRRITILDPTVGSGAFLFAALNILYPLYEACLDRMEAFVAEADQLGQTDRYPDFRQTLRELEQHPNPRYFIIKSIIVNNLYGVDIMDEAVEICKLRLFLKLAAQLDDPQQIEPLPNIDFNIRAGNTLVGYARIEDIDRLWQQVEDPQQHQSGRLGLERDHEKLKELVREYAHMLQMFRDQQLDKPTPRRITKADLERARAQVQPDLDKDLWRLYRTAGKLKEGITLAQFQRTHKPFHWFLE